MKPYYPLLSAAHILDGVEQWALPDWILLREFGIFDSGRIDGVLVTAHPTNAMMKRTGLSFWSRPGFIGIEVKRNRADFLAGLRKEQYQRYAQVFSDLYIATTTGVCKTSEIPAGIGHLVVANKDRPRRSLAVCKRHPQWRNDGAFSEELYWKALFAVVSHYSQRLHDAQNDHRRLAQTLGHAVADPIIAHARRIMDGR